MYGWCDRNETMKYVLTRMLWVIKGVGSERNLKRYKTWVIPAKQGRVRSTLHCHCVPGRVGSKMLELDLNFVCVFQMGYNIRNVRHRVSVILFCMLEVTYLITI